MKSTLTFYSENFSILFNILIGLSTYIIIDLRENSLLCSYLSLVKSFNIINSSKYELLHHVITILLNLIFISAILSNNISDYELSNSIEEYFILQRTNISTIFLILYYKQKRNIFKYLFIISFFYFRLKFLFHFFNRNTIKNIPLLCQNQNISNESICSYTMIISCLFLNLLNIFWGFQIISKVINGLKKKNTEKM